jgi:hypothetical protein
VEVVEDGVKLVLETVEQEPSMPNLSALASVVNFDFADLGTDSDEFRPTAGSDFVIVAIAGCPLEL